MSYCSLLWKTKNILFKSERENIRDNSFFSVKPNNFENISLIENSKLFTDDLKLLKLLTKCFQNLVPNLDLKAPNSLLSQTPENGDEVLSVISKYQNHRSTFFDSKISRLQCVCVCVCVCVCICVYICIYIYIYIYTYIYTHTHTYIYIYIYMFKLTKLL